MIENLPETGSANELLNNVDLAELEQRVSGWMNVDLILNITLIVTVIWLIMTIFIYWRRHVTNLTVVEAADRNKKIKPEFLRQDKKARAEALKRGDAYAKELDRRETVSESLVRDRRMGLIQRVIGIGAFVLAAGSILTIAVGSVFPSSLPGQWLSHYSSEGRIFEIIQANPITIPVSLLVIGCCIGRYVLTRKSAAPSVA